MAPSRENFTLAGERNVSSDRLWEAWRSKKALIVGFTERTGLSAARLFHRFGVDFSISDNREKNALEPLLGKLPDPSVKVFTGAQNLSQLEGIDFILLSPGVPRSIPLIREAARIGLPVWNDVDFIYPWIAGKKIAAVTGTDGKSTVTHLIHECLSASFQSVACGNNGVPVFDAYDALAGSDCAVMELSSYMLEDLHALSPSAAVVTNIAADHLDRYPDLETYAATKRNILKHAKPETLFVKNLDNIYTRVFSPTGVRVKTVSRLENADFAFREGRFHFDDGYSFDFADCELKGLHNIENILCAMAVCRDFGMASEKVAEAVKKFPGLPHRLRRIPTKRKIQVYDDSKATTLQAVERAVESFPGGLTLILGGRGKGIDFTPLGKKAALIRHLSCYGEAGEAIQKSLPGIPSSYHAKFSEAIGDAWSHTADGQALVLSPGCTSWDQHKDYHERGELFAELIRELDGAKG